MSQEIIELTIDRLSYNGGRGVGRYQGIVVFVPNTAPGDLVRARISAKKSNLWEAELVEIVKPSPHRRAPPCPVAGECGGCAWQHVEYFEQLQQKQGIVEFALKQKVKPIIPAPSEFRYRNRVQVHVQEGKIGFFAKRSQDLVTIDDCLITDAKITAQFSQIAREESGRVELSLNPEGVFSQVNSAQNENLIKIVLEAFSGEPKRIADLYAGYGNLTRPLVTRFPNAEIYAVELSEAAVRRGEKALSLVNWFAEDVEKFLRRRQKFDAIVLDPPRTGCTNAVMAALAASQAAQVVYVSCNPMTFVRDAKKLTEKNLYKLEFVQPLDMFPQTEHIELVAKFSRLA